MTSTQRYLEMADVLEAELACVPVGARVPSEHTLAARFAVSRPAARAALQELERRLLVRRVQGAGTFRRGRVEYTVSVRVPPSFSETVRRAGAEPGSHLLSCEVRRAAEPERARLGLRPGAAVWVVERVFTVNGEKAGYATSVLPRRPLTGLDRELDDNTSLHTILRRRYGLTVVRHRYRIGFDVPRSGSRTTSAAATGPVAATRIALPGSFGLCGSSMNACWASDTPYEHETARVGDALIGRLRASAGKREHVARVRM